MFEAYAAAGEGAREVLALQQVIPLLAPGRGRGPHARGRQGHGAARATAGGGDGFAKAAIRAAEQIKAATGVDLAALADRSKKP